MSVIQPRPSSITGPRPSSMSVEMLCLLLVLVLVLALALALAKQASKDDLLKVVFAWTFQKFSKTLEKNFTEFSQNFFQGISRRTFFGAYRNFPTIVKNFKNLKSSVDG